jgi:hypothetical protein
MKFSYEIDCLIEVTAMAGLTVILFFMYTVTF